MVALAASTGGSWRRFGGCRQSRLRPLRSRRPSVARAANARGAVKTDFRILPAGDSVLVVEFEERIDPVINVRAIAVAESVQAASLSAIRDVVPSYRTVAVFFDPLRTNYDALVARLEQEAGRDTPNAGTERTA